MTDPATSAMVDQLDAADRQVAEYIMSGDAGTASTFPDVGPLVGEIVAGMVGAIRRRYGTGRDVGCRHLSGAPDVGLWFPWCANLWLCPTCAADLVGHLDTPGGTCDYCAATVEPSVDNMVDVRFAAEVEGHDHAGRLRVSPPLLAKLVLCADCRDRNDE